MDCDIELTWTHSVEQHLTVDHPFQLPYVRPRILLARIRNRISPAIESVVRCGRMIVANVPGERCDTASDIDDGRCLVDVRRECCVEVQRSVRLVGCVGDELSGDGGCHVNHLS